MQHSTKSFLIIIDEATRYVYAKSMKQSGKALKNFFIKHPQLKLVKKIVSDRGKSFVAGEFNDWIKRNINILQTTTPYHPAGNGLAERTVREIKTFLSCYPNFPGGWKKCLEAAVNHHNRTYNEYLGCTSI